jgi:hypothetical protein
MLLVLLFKFGYCWLNDCVLEANCNGCPLVGTHIVSANQKAEFIINNSQQLLNGITLKDLSENENH